MLFVRQVPLTAKQPAERLNPPAEVVVPVPLIARFPPNVEVAVVVPVKYEPTISPTTESLAYGVVVPMPTLPDTVAKFAPLLYSFT